MRLLLDTHIWLWALLDPGRISSAATRAVEDGRNELWLSPISVWECLLLARRGRITLDADPNLWVKDALRSFPLRDATMTRDIALVSRTVDLPHEDPADRFI
ncbi:MAG: type II toxin-antitoxin system VapC family toxin, partial [Actinobacteria bacterium]|nr:type II toxin-antitoxin system VapC family toxin [Actinomycetota bacterium]